MAEKEKTKATETADKIIAEAEAKAAELVAKMFADAEAKIAEMYENASKGETKPVIDDTAAKLNAEMEKKVIMKFLKDNGKYKDDIFVQVNGENMRIPRGKYVEIPKKFLAVIEQSDLQDAQTATLMQEHDNAFVNESRARNI